MTGDYSADVRETIHRVKLFLARRRTEGRPVSYAQLAHRVGVSSATISNFINQRPIGDPAKTAVLLADLITIEEARDAEALASIPYVETAQAKRLNQAILFCLQFSRLAAALAPPGTGKTFTLAEAQRRHLSLVVVRAARFFSPLALYREIASELSEPTNGGTHAVYARLIERLTGSRRCVVIDDAHMLSTYCLDAVQSLYDRAGIGVLLLGCQSLGRRLAGVSEDTEQLASRLAGRIYSLPPVTEADLALILSAVLGDDDVAAVLDLLRRADPASIASPRRMGNLIEIAGQIASRKKEPLAERHIAAAVKAAA